MINTYPGGPEMKVESYTHATLAALNNIVQAPEGYNVLQGVFAHGVTLSYLTLQFSKTSSDFVDVPAFDMPVETDELTQSEDPYIPLNIPLASGEFINLTGGATLGAEGRIYFRFSRSPMGEKMRCIRHAYTNTDTEPAAFTPANTMDDLGQLRGYLHRGIDLEAAQIGFAGRKLSWYPGVDCDALNNIQIPPRFSPMVLNNISNAEMLAYQIHHGAGGASELFLLYTPKR